MAPRTSEVVLRNDPRVRPRFRGNRTYATPRSMFGRFLDEEHRQDFCDAIRNQRRPNADIEEGHRSTPLSQFANISYRLGGEKLEVDESFRNSDAANRLLKREYRAPWVVPERVERSHR